MVRIWGNKEIVIIKMSKEVTGQKVFRCANFGWSTEVHYFLSQEGAVLLPKSECEVAITVGEGLATTPTQSKARN